MGEEEGEKEWEGSWEEEEGVTHAEVSNGEYGKRFFIK